jgi:hypothetical protein
MFEGQPKISTEDAESSGGKLRQIAIVAGIAAALGAYEGNSKVAYADITSESITSQESFEKALGSELSEVVSIAENVIQKAGGAPQYELAQQMLEAVIGLRITTAVLVEHAFHGDKRGASETDKKEMAGRMIEALDAGGFSGDAASVVRGVLERYIGN